MENSVSLSVAAEALGVSYKSAWHAARQGKIPALQLWPGGAWRVNAQWVDKARSAEDSNIKNG